jgi:CRP-like cAMP-binding protein
MGHGQGGYCPFLEERLAAGSVIFEEGSDAEFSWYLKDGVVGLIHEGGKIEVVQGPTDVLGPTLIKLGRRTARAVAITEVLVCRGANTVLSQHGEPS